MLAILRDALPMCDGVLQIVAEYCKNEIHYTMGPDLTPGYYYDNVLYQKYRGKLLAVALINNIYCQVCMTNNFGEISIYTMGDVHIKNYSGVYQKALFDIFVTDKMYVEDLSSISIYEFLPDFNLQLTHTHNTQSRLKYADDKYIITGIRNTIQIYDTNFNLLKNISLDQSPYIVCFVDKIIIYDGQKRPFAQLANLEVRPV
jgi:hypothetical protein